MSETSSPRTNRRLTARHACHLTVRYRVGPDWHPATAMDLSIRGCRLRLGEDLPRESAVVVGFESPPVEGRRTLEVEVAGAVMWCRREGLSFQAGIHFQNAPDQLEQILNAVA
jgi:PilZ domain